MSEPAITDEPLVVLQHRGKGLWQTYMSAKNVDALTIFHVIQIRSPIALFVWHVGIIKDSVCRQMLTKVSILSRKIIVS